MTDQAKIAWKTLGLSLLVLLPFVAHLFFSGVIEYRAPVAGDIAAKIRRSYSKGLHEALDEFVNNFFPG